jgi:hypothetical protein
MVDRQGRFPLPNVGLMERGEAKRLGGLKDTKTVEERARENGKSPQKNSAAVRSSSASDGRTEVAVAEGEGVEKEKPKVISPELRLLLSRKVIELDRLEESIENGAASGTRASGLKD